MHSKSRYAHKIFVLFLDISSAFCCFFFYTKPVILAILFSLFCWYFLSVVQRFRLYFSALSKIYSQVNISNLFDMLRIIMVLDISSKNCYYNKENVKVLVINILNSHFLKPISHYINDHHFNIFINKFMSLFLQFHFDSQHHIHINE